MKLIEKEDKELVEDVIKSYSEIPDYSPIKNKFHDFLVNEVTYKLIRLNDSQFSMLCENTVTLDDDYWFLIYLSRLNNIYSSYSKIYTTLKSLFGESGDLYDNWKGSFSFPFLIHFEKNGKIFDYLLNIKSVRTSIEFRIAKLINASNTKFRREVLHEPFEEFTREEIHNLIKYFIGFLEGYFNSYIKKTYNKSYFKTINSEHIIFGYHNGKFFDKHYESEKRFENAIQLMEEKLLNENKAEGKAEGKVEEKTEMVIKLLKKGMALDFIADVTGLSEQEIQKIKKDNNI